jgi:ankyrin repeat protein
MVELLLERQASVHVTNLEGRTPLFYAVMVKRLDILERLVDAGANLIVADRYTRTAMYYARMLGVPPIERFLAEHGLMVSFIEES